ncbi:DUF779 domain-containing protein [Aquabacterium sp. OR-4]|uniref:DUF779 domain-containing protein n=1 Tax=Aquabacterium sp. OR-4 TaxID=2978127 RepID=UPI0021B42FC1|nr:DUF779 domain-containing protein [Aquabacterium sp. OR-4]MDT7835720.1 DUF779 domain-containing protein [Aquabacterium sp. OR-4]
MSDPIERVQASPAALALIAQLRQRHGQILFYQSHGCCAGSAPMCFAVHELGLNEDDRLLGSVGDVPVYASLSQCDYLAGLHMTLDVAPGDSGSFGLEDGSGQHFTAHFRLWTDDELPRLAPITPAKPGA